MYNQDGSSPQASSIRAHQRQDRNSQWRNKQAHHLMRKRKCLAKHQHKHTRISTSNSSMHTHRYSYSYSYNCADLKEGVSTTHT
ncbi:uncharacterized protein K452DRAFT_104402 [Aplosporella prunicola CBS 121167]|uniref:Uncharacterized protein n=1 Tax=Aplosporella prunicola CBS 121167 TaxID=1176127 RepID=A0A6A6BPC5_9PEZI|nr:uncharacterized protein K452DRAFT_104402 [Aplosporella prunicola CBS 121167]KAF2145989.1 hypothetical protein K452DRAFT_104402 [Aplosporella prunicola CBS 121167]